MSDFTYFDQHHCKKQTVAAVITSLFMGVLNFQMLELGGLAHWQGV